MDERDRQIIALLQEDGRATNANIARQVGVSEGTVRRRLNRLFEEEYIRVVALPDSSKLGLSSEALIGVQVEPDKADLVAKDLAALEEVKWVVSTTGSFDVFAWAALPNAEALGVFLRSRIGTIDGVRRTETFVRLALNKQW